MNEDVTNFAAVLLSGDTYPVRRALAAAGGTWSADLGGYLWTADHLETAARLAAQHGLAMTNVTACDADLRAPSYAQRRTRHKERLERAAARRGEWADAALDKADGAMPPPRDYAFITQPASPSSALGRLKERDRASLARVADHSRRADEHRAAAASAAAAADRMERAESDPAFITRRIEEAESAIRGIDRQAAEARALRPADDAYQAHLADRRAAETDKLAYWRERLDTAGGVTFGPHNVRAGDAVRVRGQWARVARVNAKTVSVETGYSWTDKYPWAEVKDHRPADALDAAAADLKRTDAERAENAPPATFGPHNVRRGDRIVYALNGRTFTVRRVNPKTVTATFEVQRWLAGGNGRVETVERKIGYSSIRAVLPAD